MSGVFVTGATGTVGSAVVDALLRRGEHVIAGMHRPVAAGHPPVAVEARPFRFGAAAAEVAETIEGADRLFLLRPPAIADVRSTLFPVIDAAQRRGIRQIVFLSLQGAQVNRSTPHHAVERYLRATAVPATLLRPNFFMQNLSTTYAAEIRDQGQIIVPAGRSHTAFIDARDVGRVAAAALTDPRHIGRAYTLSGEHSLSYQTVAATMTRVLGRPIKYARPTELEYLDHLTAAGRPADYVAVQRMIYRMVRRNISAIPNRMVRRLTGEPAIPFDQFVADHRAVWASPSG